MQQFLYVLQLRSRRFAARFQSYRIRYARRGFFSVTIGDSVAVFDAMLDSFAAA